LQSAFGRHGNASQSAQAAEVLQQETIGQAGGKGAVLLIEEGAGNITAQSSASVELTFLLLPGRSLGVALEPLIEVLLDELVFQTAGLELLVDGEELITQEAIIDIAFNGGQSRRQGELEGNDFGVHES